MLLRKISRWFLNISMSPWSLFLSWVGIKLNSWTPFTARDPSLAFLTHAGADKFKLAGTALLPVLL